VGGVTPPQTKSVLIHLSIEEQLAAMAKEDDRTVGKFTARMVREQLDAGYADISDND
jgi:hypothetical protein